MHLKSWSIGLEQRKWFQRGWAFSIYRSSSSFSSLISFGWFMISVTQTYCHSYCRQCLHNQRSQLRYFSRSYCTIAIFLVVGSQFLTIYHETQGINFHGTRFSQWKTNLAFIYNKLIISYFLIHNKSIKLAIYSGFGIQRTAIILPFKFLH